MNSKTMEKDLFEILKDEAWCEYISDLNYGAFNKKAKASLKNADIENYSLFVLSDRRTIHIRQKHEIWVVRWSEKILPVSKQLKMIHINGGNSYLISKLKNFDVGLSCILACIYFTALPLTITINAAGNSFLKLLTIPIAGYLAASVIFYKGKLELNAGPYLFCKNVFEHSKSFLIFRAITIYTI